MKHIPLALLGILICALVLSVARADAGSRENNRTSYIFDIMDVDDNSLLSFAEFYSPLGNNRSRDQWAESGRRFAVLDVNTDGNITTEEFAAGWRLPYPENEILRVQEGMSTE